jgi:formylglycine-generating enzyme required for sulfatase activity
MRAPLVSSLVAAACLTASALAAEQREVPGLGVTLVKVAAGSFTMGDPPAPNGNLGDTISGSARPR